MTAYSDPDRARYEAYRLLDRDNLIEMPDLVRFHGTATRALDHVLTGASLTLRPIRRAPSDSGGSFG